MPQENRTFCFFVCTLSTLGGGFAVFMGHPTKMNSRFMARNGMICFVGGIAGWIMHSVDIANGGY